MSISSISFDRQIGRAFVAFGLVLALIASAFIPALASAAQLTERSIALSSASASATDVTYQVNFTAAGDATAVVLDFCANSPVLTEDCTAPTGFDASGAALSSASTTAGYALGTLDTPGDNKVLVTGTIEEDDAVTFTLEGVDNPTEADTIYARIVTYNGDATEYVSGTPGTHADDGSVAIFITDTIGVSGAVLESMTFCVSGAAIDPDCDVDPDSPPVLKLGVAQGDVVALVPGTLSTGDIYTQITTNAAKGAVVSLKSTAYGCGGLLRAGAPDACDIKPALQTGIVEATDSKFGLKLGTPTGGTGTLQPYTGSGYNTSTYVLNYADEDATGVTSTFGDPFLDTNNGPVSNKNLTLTFGAVINNSTPAGLYSTDLSLIATGTF